MSARKINDLTKLNGRVYLYFRDNKTIDCFIADAEAEGFHYADGVSLRERRPQQHMALNANRTINFLGFVGHMAFGAAESVGGQKLIRVDYARYFLGEADYFFHRQVDGETGDFILNSD